MPQEMPVHIKKKNFFRHPPPRHALKGYCTKYLVTGQDRNFDMPVLVRFCPHQDGLVAQPPKNILKPAFVKLQEIILTARQTMNVDYRIL